jgi:hypothetical protein
MQSKPHEQEELEQNLGQRKRLLVLFLPAKGCHWLCPQEINL